MPARGRDWTPEELEIVREACARLGFNEGTKEAAQRLRNRTQWAVRMIANREKFSALHSRIRWTDDDLRRLGRTFEEGGIEAVRAAYPRSEPRRDQEPPLRHGQRP
jgi:hypothetical protein